MKSVFLSSFRFLASLKLAVVLMVGLAVVLGCATTMETRHGAAYARWYVYESAWFVALLALLGVNIFAAAAIRFPWKRQQTGFVITHLGLLVLLAGAIQSFVGGIEGSVTLAEGESTKQMLLAERSRLSAFWLQRPEEAPYEFAFDAGPADWRSGRKLDLGEVDGVAARVLNFYRHARPVERWTNDESATGWPAVKFRVAGPDGATVAEPWLADTQFGDAVMIGPLRLQLQRAANDGMLKDFLNPPTHELGEKGVLAMYYRDVAQHVSPGDHVGEMIELGDTGVAVEIAEYLPNARPDGMGTFASQGERPKNPMVELRVHVEGQEKPLRQIAFAKEPLLNLDGVYAQVCPVKFRYRHPAIVPHTAVELMQAADGKLYGRICSSGQYTPKGELHAGAEVAVASNFQLTITEHMPHARRQVTFESVQPAAGAKVKPEPAVQVEISAGGVPRQVWLQRNNMVYGRRKIVTPAGTLSVGYEYGRVPLGFTLSLVDFQREMNPGKVGNAAFASQVRVVDEAGGVDDEREISMNQPLRHGKLTFYQSGFDDGGHGQETSTFSVAYDPGRRLKYAGSLMICLGIATMFYMRAYFFRKVKWDDTSSTTADRETAPQVALRKTA